MVRFDAGDGRGRRTFIVPNIDIGPPGPANGADPNESCRALAERMLAEHRLSGPVGNRQQVGTWTAACPVENSVEGLLDVICTGDLTRPQGRSQAIVYWVEHANGQTVTGFLPCPG